MCITSSSANPPEKKRTPGILNRSNVIHLKVYRSVTKRMTKWIRKSAEIRSFLFFIHFFFEKGTPYFLKCAQTTERKGLTPF